MAKLFPLVGAPVEIAPADGKRFTFEEFYALIETNIVQLVYLRDKEVMVVCEEGKIRGKPPNPLATEFALSRGWWPIPGDVLVGPAIHCKLNQIR